MIHTYITKRTLVTLIVLSVAFFSVAFSVPKAQAAVTQEELTAMQVQVDNATKIVADLAHVQGQVLGLFTSKSSRGNDWASSTKKLTLQKQITELTERIETFTKAREALQKQLNVLSSSSTPDRPVQNSQKITLKAVSDGAELEGTKGVFTVKFDVSAVQDTVYINKNAGQGAFRGERNGGVSYSVYKKQASSSDDGDDDNKERSVATRGNASTTLSSTAIQEGNFYKVMKGETKTFTFKLEYKAPSAGSYQLQLTRVHWNTTAVASNKNTKAKPSSDFTTDLLVLPKSATTNSSN